MRPCSETPIASTYLEHVCAHTVRATRRDRLPEGPACVTHSSSGALGLLTTIAQSMERIVEGRQGGRQAPQRVRSTVEDH